MNTQFLTELDILLAQHGMQRKNEGFKITIIDPAGAKRDFGLDVRWLGLEQDDYGAIVTVQNRRFKIVGAKSSRPKYPINGECLRTGKVYKLPRSVIPQIIAERQQTPAPTPTSMAPTNHYTSSPSSTQTSDAYADAAIF